MEDGGGAGCLAGLDGDFMDDLLGETASVRGGRFVSAGASATFFSGDVGLFFSITIGGKSSSSAMDERGVNSLEARGVDTVPTEPDLPIVSLEAVRCRMGTIRTVAVEPSLGWGLWVGWVVAACTLAGSDGAASVSVSIGISDAGSSGASLVVAGALPFALAAAEVGAVLLGVGEGGILPFAAHAVLTVLLVDFTDTGLPPASVVAGFVTFGTGGTFGTGPARLDTVDRTDVVEVAD